MMKIFNKKDESLRSDYKSKLVISRNFRGKNKNRWERGKLNNRRRSEIKKDQSLWIESVY